MAAIMIVLIAAALASFFTAYLLSYVLYAVARYGPTFSRQGNVLHAALRHQSTASEPYDRIFYQLLVLLYMILVSFIFDTKLVWSIQSILGGLGAAALLLREAATARRGPLIKLCLYIAGFIMIFEVILLIRAAMKAIPE